MADIDPEKSNDIKAVDKSADQLLTADRIANMPAREKFLNRELSWLQFNMRVLEEADNKNHPLLERLRFLSISGYNLDEFYMVRVAGLKGQLESQLDIHSDDGLTPPKQLKNVNEFAKNAIDIQQATWSTLYEEMQQAGIHILNYEDVLPDDKSWLENYFLTNVFPLITPLAVDPAHPFPFIPNLGFTMALSLSRRSDDKPVLALLPVPNQIKRFIRLPGEDVRFISLDNLLRLFLDQLFPGYTVSGCGVFRVLRDSDIEIEDEAEDLVRVFETALKRRRRGRVIRLSIDGTMPEDLQKLIISRMEADDESVMIVNGILDIAGTDQLITEDNPDLLFKPFAPRYPERVKDHGGDIFKTIRSKDFVVHHPYESFDVVHEFVLQAARDPNVVAIKQLLYRAGSQSEIINALIEAAENGKTVTAVIELKARFDEEQNIKWARDLERAGVHVVYGFLDLKTHAKAAMVVRREGEHLNTYAHLGTGNYHPITAKVYTDLSYFTTSKEIVRDLNKLFNYVTGYIEPVGMEKMAISPLMLRSHLIANINAEIEFAKEGKPAAIWAKLNSLLDPTIIEKLYEASCAGVQIDLVVRGICTLRPGIKDLSENIRVKSIVGRFLEHARIVCFGNGEGIPSKLAKVFITSADWMPRNFDRRVETLVPVENETVHAQIIEQVMAANFKDNIQSWTMNEDGTYTRVYPGDDEMAFSAHEYFMTNPSMSGRGTARVGVTPVSPGLNY